MADNETTSFQASAFTGQGAARDKVALPTEYFDGTINMPVMHQAVKTYLANQRQGNASTKTRGFVIGGNQNFAPLSPSPTQTSVRFGIPLTTFGHSGETFQIQVYGVDVLGNQGGTSSRQIHIR